MPNSPEAWASLSKDIANVAFFVVVGTVTVLSYWRAKATLFTPLKTEIFKAQLKDLGDAFAFLQEVKEHDRALFDFRTIVSLNACTMLDVYAESAFPGVLDRTDEYKKKVREASVGALVRDEAFNSVLTWPGPTKTSGPKDSPGAWDKYQHLMIAYTPGYRDASARLARFETSPFLPKRLREVFRDLKQVAGGNLSEVGHLLTSLAPKVSGHYPSVETLEHSDLTWVWNEFNRRWKSMEPLADAGLAYVDKYLSADSLLSPSPAQNSQSARAMQNDETQSPREAA